MSKPGRGPARGVEISRPTPPDESEKLTLRDRILRYGDLKTRQLAIAEYLGNLGSLHASVCSERLSECGKYLTFRDYYTVQEVRLTRACFCKKHTLCQLCAVRRAAKFLEKTLPKFEQIFEDYPAPLYAHFIVFTVKNGPDCAERIRHIESSWQKLRRRVSKPRQYPDTFLRSIVGGVLSLEVTNIGNGWHPHLNVMCLSTSPSFDWAAVKREWFEITGDSSVVYFSQDCQNLRATLAETVKYVTKFSDLAPADLWTLHKALQRRRTLRGFGCLHNLHIPEKLTDAPLEADLPYIEYVCRYMGRDGYTILRALRSAAGASAA